MAEELCRTGEVDKVSRMFKLGQIVQSPSDYLHKIPDMVQTADNLIILIRDSCPWKKYTLVA